MFLTSCILLCFTVVATHQNVFTYVKLWGPFRRSITECEMCYKGDCVFTNGARCEYYSEASKLISEEDDFDRGDVDKNDPNIRLNGDKIDAMLFELIDSVSTRPQFKGCVPLVSQYTDCTEGSVQCEARDEDRHSTFILKKTIECGQNICTGCKFCSCNKEGTWICREKQKCRPEPKLTIDHRVIGIVIENLKKNGKSQEKRVKRSADDTNVIPENIKDKLTYTNISKWMFGVKPPGNDQIAFDRVKNLENRKDNEAKAYEIKGIIVTTDASINISENYMDLLEFNDILQSWTTDKLTSAKPLNVIDTSQTFTRHNFEESNINDIYNTEYDPIRLIKRDIFKQELTENDTIVQINTTKNNFSYDVILTDALQGLNKITKEKQRELEGLLVIQNNLLNIVKAHNIHMDINLTDTHDHVDKHHIAIYKLDSFEKCVAKVKHDIYNEIENSILSNSSDFQRELKELLSTIKKYVLRASNKVGTKTNALSSQECEGNSRRHVESDNRYIIVNSITQLGNILAEINNISEKPLNALSQHARKIFKRIIKHLYFDNFAVIDFIVHETYYDFDRYLESIGTKWNKMTQDILDSEVIDTLYRIKLLHITLNADISKIEDMITLLEFARNRRMTVANEVSVDKSILRIQNNLQLIDNNVQKILTLEKTKRTRKNPSVFENKPEKRKSILQKLKKMFQSSKNDIKNMLRKRFPKTEIIKQIAKKKIDELEKQRMMEYQETMKRWHDNINIVSRREKRSPWGFQTFASRIKSIIPEYLRGKVKPGLHKKRVGNRTQTTRTHWRKQVSNTTRPTVRTTIAKKND